MIFLLAAIVTLLGVCVSILGDVASFGFLNTILRWAEGFPFGYASWWLDVSEWFIFPLAWLVIFCLLFISLWIILGSPRQAMRAVDWPRQINTEQKGIMGFRERMWLALFELLIFRVEPEWEAPFSTYVIMAAIGTVAAIVAVLATLLPEQWFAGTSHPSLALAMALVTIGIGRAHSTVSAHVKEIRKENGESSALEQSPPANPPAVESPPEKADPNPVRANGNVSGVQK